MVVVFPAPLGPSKPKISPSKTLNESRSTAVSAPNCRVSSRVTTTAGALVVPVEEGEPVGFVAP